MICVFRDFVFCSTADCPHVYIKKELFGIRNFLSSPDKYQVIVFLFQEGNSKSIFPVPHLLLKHWGDLVAKHPRELWENSADLYLSDLFLGQLQFVRLVGPQQLGLGLSLLLQCCLSILPTLPRLHPEIKRPLQVTNTRQILSRPHLVNYFCCVASRCGCQGFRSVIRDILTVFYISMRELWEEIHHYILKPS